jgi:predicted Fe-Mo cluster-binding NifX family protein
MKVAIGTGDGVTVTEHFGYSLQFQIWDFSGPAPKLLEVRRNIPACGANRDDENARDPMDVSVDLVSDCGAVVVARIGECAVNRLDALGILSFETDDAVETALRELAESGLITGRAAA